MILQTSVKISIFLQDRYNPIAHGYFRVCFWVAVGASGVGKLPQQHSWWWPCGLSFFPLWWWRGQTPTPPHTSWASGSWFRNLKLCLFPSWWWWRRCKDLWTSVDRLWSSFRISILSGLTDRERETVLSSEENFACCLTGCCLPLDLTTLWKKKKKHTKKKILLFKNVVLL